MMLLIWWCDYFVSSIFNFLEFELFDVVILDLNKFVVIQDELKLIYENFMLEFVLFFFKKNYDIDKMDF